MSGSQTIIELLARGKAAAPAITAPGRPDLSYGALRDQAGATITALNALGAGRDDAVAIVLPNGPEMAAAFVAIAAGATTAPLNPGYTAGEFEFYLQDLAARLLVVEAGSTSPAVAVARKLGIPIAEPVVSPGAADRQLRITNSAGTSTVPANVFGGEVTITVPAARKKYCT